MNPLLNNPLSGGCAFPSVAAALRLPAASLCTSACRSRSRRRWPSLARAGSDGSDGAVAGAVTEGEAGVGAGGQRGASAEPSAEKQQPIVNPKIEKELKKVGIAKALNPFAVAQREIIKLYLIRLVSSPSRQFRRPRRRLRRGRPPKARTPPCPDPPCTPSLRSRRTPPCLPAAPFPSTSSSPPASRTFGGSWGCGPSGCSVSKTCFPAN